MIKTYILILYQQLEYYMLIIILLLNFIIISHVFNTYIWLNLIDLFCY